MQVDDSDRTSAECAETARRLAEDAFAHHEVLRDGPLAEWLCRRPGTSAYHFRVIARPGTLIVWGDIGDWILSMSDVDPVRWAAQAVRSPGYFFEKVRAACTEGGDAFYPADLKEWLRRGLAEAGDTGERAEKYQQALDGIEERESEWDYLSHEMAMEVLSELGFEEVGHLGVAPSGRSHWLLEAMRWFTSRVSSSEMSAAPKDEGDRHG